MTPAAFYFARLTGNEAALATHSVAPTQMLNDLAGKHVALVGNARAMADASNGPDIDAADIVIRINQAPIPSVASHGSRTDWLALATRLARQQQQRIAPKRVLWMSHKRKRLAYHIAASPGFYLHPLADWRALGEKFDAPPSTGAMMIDLLARSTATRISLFGFDFFASGSLTGQRTAAQVPHDFSAESDFVRNLAATEARITLAPL